MLLRQERDVERDDAVTADVVPSDESAPAAGADVREMTISEVKSLVAGAPPEPGDALWRALEADPRKGVRSILEAALRRRSLLEATRRRESRMRRFEAELWEKGIASVAGVDEAGRGPLAGPVVAGAVILPRDLDVTGIDDSKKLTPAKRDQLFDRIREEAVAVGVGRSSHERIDEVNILNATFEAMRDAVAGLSARPGHVLVDGDAIPGLRLPQTGIPRGDELSAAIAAASIIAKVTRDRLMVALDAEYPGYGFAQHKGYGTSQHLAALARLGPCEIHRRSFHAVREAQGGPSELYGLFRSELLSAEDVEALDAVARSIADERERLDAYELGRLRSLYKRCYVRLKAGVRAG